MEKIPGKEMNFLTHENSRISAAMVWLVAYLSYNAFTMTGAVLAVSSAFTIIGFWIYDFTTGGTINTYIGLIFILILIGIFSDRLGDDSCRRTLAAS